MSWFLYLTFASFAAFIVTLGWASVRTLIEDAGERRAAGSPSSRSR